MSFSNFKNEDNKVALAMDLKNEKKIVEGNAAIAKFMGGLMPFASRDMYGKETGTRYIEIEKVKRGFEDLRVSYHTSWDWLHPVIEKIQALDAMRNDVAWMDEYLFTDYSRCVEILQRNKKDKISLIWRKSHTEPKINAVWLAVIEFINWFNQNKK